MTVATEDPIQRLNDEMTGLWGQAGELLRGQSRVDARLGRLETDVAGLKTDVAGLKTDVAGLKTDVVGLSDRLSRFELATDRRFNRVDAQLERLITLVQRDETKRS